MVSTVRVLVWKDLGHFYGHGQWWSPQDGCGITKSALVPVLPGEMNLTNSDGLQVNSQMILYNSTCCWLMGGNLPRQIVEIFTFYRAVGCSG